MRKSDLRLHCDVALIPGYLNQIPGVNVRAQRSPELLFRLR